MTTTNTDLIITTAADLLARYAAGERIFGSRAYLSGADLYRADLSRADLSRADLYRAYLYRADLSGADLSRANLSRANLSRANLSGADLSGASNLETAWIISFPTTPWSVLVSPTRMKIGCQDHTHAEWREFDDATIARMAPREALPFWQTWRVHLLALCDAAVACLASVQPAVAVADSEPLIGETEVQS